MPTLPTVAGLTQISYTYSGSLDYGITYNWTVIASNPCFDTPGPVQQFTMINLPDLIVSQVLPPVSAFSGQPVDISWTVKNVGSGSTGTQQWQDVVYLSTDATLETWLDLYWGDYSNQTFLNPGQSYQRVASLTLPQGINGTYYVFVWTDIYNALNETNNQNNLTYDTSGMIVNLTPPPDLQVTSIIIPINVFSGQNMNVQWTVTNMGTGPTLSNGWSDRVYLSTSTAFDPGNSTILGTYPHTGNLLIDSAYTQAKVVTIPNFIFGTYYIYVTTDLNNQEYEHANETNNTTRSDSLHIILTPPPDLVVTDVTYPAVAPAGQWLKAEWTVKNVGGSATLPGNWWVDRTFLCDSAEFDPDHCRELWDINHDGVLNVDQTYHAVVNAGLPLDADGVKFIFVHTDYHNWVFEYLNDDNNILGGDTIFITTPDLVVTSFSVPSADTTGDPVNIKWWVKNEGSAYVVNRLITDRIFLSYSPVYHPDSVIEVTSMTYRITLGPGEILPRQRTINLPRIVGPYYMWAYTDYTNQVYEASHEDNNVLRSDTLVIIKRPDLAVLNVEVPEVDSTGQPITVSYTLKNVGPVKLYYTNLTDEIFFSASPVFHPDSVFSLGNNNYSEVLLPGGEAELETSVLWPDTLGPAWPDTWYCFVDADTADVIFENGNESNNRGWSDSTIQIIRPDLTVTALQVPGTGNSGQMISITWTDKNLGPGTIFNRNWTDRIAISPDAVYNPATAVTLEDEGMTHTLFISDTLQTELDVFLPNGISGTYYIHLIADAEQEIKEGPGEGNNVLTSGPLQVTLTPWPDLQVSIYFLEDTLQAGTTFDLDLWVANIGEGIAQGFWMDQVYISRYSTWDTSQVVFLGESPAPFVIMPDSSYEQQMTINLPSDLEEGYYYLYFRLDGHNTLYEHTGESNNISRTSQVYVGGYPVDLAVLQYIAPDTAYSGQPVVLYWEVSNISTVATLAGVWTDAVFLSANDQWDPLDTQLEEFVHSGDLDPGTHYTMNRSVTLPEGVTGDHYLILVADSADYNRDIDFTNNIALPRTPSNQVHATHILLTPPPDLVVSDINTTATAISGQPLAISWTVSNDGIGPTGTDTWVDKIFLSTDYEIDTTDIYIATFTHEGQLDAGADYTCDQDVLIPMGTHGNYIMVIVTDFNEKVFEYTGELNNSGFKSLTVVLPPPADLVVESVTLPETCLAGQPLTIEWSIGNEGDNPASGVMTDMIYFSADDEWDIGDALFGELQGTVSIPPSQSQTRSLNAPVPGVMPGEYFVIVRTDIRNNIYEVDEGNNTGVSSDITGVSIRELTLGIIRTDTLPDNGMFYYRVVIPAGLESEVMLVTIEGDTLNGSTELYISHGEVPTTVESDFSSRQPFESRQQLVVPDLENGIYYIMVTGFNNMGDIQEVTTLAQIVPFELLTIDADHGGNTGPVTVKLTGSRFSPYMAVKLENDSVTVKASNLHFVNSTQVFVTFDLDSIPPGFFDVVADSHCEGMDTLVDGFKVENGQAPALSINVYYPSVSWVNGIVRIQLDYENTGNTDLILDPLDYTSHQLAPISFNYQGLTQGLTMLEIPLSEAGLPGNLMRPGYRGSVTIYVKASKPMVFYFEVPEL